MKRLISLYLILLIPVFLVLIYSRVYGRDLDGRYAQSDPQRKAWFEGLHSGKGPCCADADGNTLKDNEWKSVNDPKKPRIHYSVQIENQWVDVPDEAVLNQPNLYGRTIVWPIYYRNYKGETHIDVRCFIPGSEG